MCVCARICTHAHTHTEGTVSTKPQQPDYPVNGSCQGSGSRKLTRESREGDSSGNGSGPWPVKILSAPTRGPGNCLSLLDLLCLSGSKPDVTAGLVKSILTLHPFRSTSLPSGAPGENLVPYSAPWGELPAPSLGHS